MLWRKQRRDSNELEEGGEEPLPGFEAPQLPDPVQLEALESLKKTEYTPKSIESVYVNSKLVPLGFYDEKDLKVIRSYIRETKYYASLIEYIISQRRVRDTNAPLFHNFVTEMFLYVNSTRGKGGFERELMNKSIIATERRERKWRM